MASERQTVRLAAGRRLARLHPTAYDPIFFGPDGPDPVHRYDAPDGAFKVLYAALTLKAAVGEVLVRNPARRYVFTSEIEPRASAVLRLTRDVTLAALHDERMSSWGVSLTDLTAGDYAATQALAAAVHAHDVAIDGILYPSRFSARCCLALFDRAADAVRQVGASRPLRIERVESLLAAFGKAVADDGP